MARFDFPPPSRQVYMAAFLARVRETGLHDAVRDAARQVAATTLRSELSAHAPADGLQAIQGTGVRVEVYTDAADVYHWVEGQTRGPHD